MTIDKDEWEIWRSNPITEAYFAKIEAEIERTRHAWIALAWDRGDLSDKEYAYHKARVNALSYMASLEYEDIFESEESTDASSSMEKDRSNG